MAEFATGARAVELVLILIGLEAVLLIGLWRFGLCPLPPRSILLILAPGTCLLFAAHAALSGATFEIVSSLFLLALIIHLIDLRQRWRERQGMNSAHTK
jgi:hypothetical protein